MARDKDKIHPFFFHARFEAKTLLQKLDARFEPHVYLVGFPLEKGKGIVTHPNDSPFRPEDFRGVENRVAELIPLDPEYHMERMPDPEHGWTDVLWDLVTWFHGHAFYLTAQECEEIERLNDEAMRNRPPGTFDVRHGGKLEPNLEMDDSYYLPE